MDFRKTRNSCCKGKGAKVKRLMAVEIACLLTGTTLIAAEVPKFDSVGQAFAEFTTNNVACRRPAFEYVGTVLATERDPVRLRSGFGTLRTMADRLKDNEAYLIYCRKALKSEHEGQRFAGAVALVNGMQEGEEARRLFDELKSFITRDGALEPSHVLSVVKMMADMLAGRIADVNEACDFLDEHINLASTNVVFRCGCLSKQMVLLKSANRDDDAVKKADELRSFLNCPSVEFFAASCLKAEVAVQNGDASSAERYLMEALKREKFVPSGFARQMARIRASPVACETAVSHIRARIASVPLSDIVPFRAMVERAQPEIVELLCQMGRFDEALGECRVMLFFAPPRTYQNAVGTTADVMRREDGNLGRALSFLNFQKRDTVPKASNVLFSVPQLNDDERRKGREELANFIDEGWSSYLPVAWRLLWLDSPQDSMSMAERAFAKAPINSKSLQSCANAIMHPVAIATRDPVALKRIADYLLYGPAGADGKTGTSDDLGNPLVELKAKLALPGKK